MTPAPEWYRRAAEAFAAPPADGEARAQLAANLRVSLVAGVVGGGLGTASNALAGRVSAPLVLAGLTGVCLLGLWLLRRGHVLAAAGVALPGIVVAVAALMALGYGIHDRAALLLPVVILVAALALDRSLLVGTTALCVVSAMAVAGLDRAGRVPLGRGRDLDWLPFVDTAIILVVTAIAAHLLVAGAMRSQSALRESERRLAAANRALEERNSELERFTYVVSHDLRSPLVTIRGFLSYLERDARAGDTARLETDLLRIRGATDRMSQLLDDVLELSRTGRIDRPHADVPFEEVVREAAAATEGRYAARGARLIVDLPLPVVRGDRQRLVELVQNLLENAAKFMGDQARPEVRVGARSGAGGPGQSVLFVADNGVGIEPQHHERVFDLFRRLDPGAEGTGLGLALARRIVETHGGRIWVESAGLGRGSTFCFTLPAGGADAA